MTKNILLVGGSHGIGMEIAKKLSQHCNVYVASRSNKALANLNVTHIPFDALTEDLSTKKIPEEIHGFVYCPGSINLKPFKMLDGDMYRNDMELNFFGLIKTVKSVVSRMMEGSSLVFFSTVAVGTGMPFHTSVAAAKGAVEGFARSLAAEYSPKFRVNVIAPSLTDTPLSERLLNSNKKREMMAARHPMKRVGSTVDITNATLFLLDDENSWVTGQVLRVDGGLSSLNVQ